MAHKINAVIYTFQYVYNVQNNEYKVHTWKQADSGFTLSPGLCSLSGAACGTALAIYIFIFLIFVFGDGVRLNSLSKMNI
jgi:hypothetical protein